MVQYRTFRNTDPPRLVEVWNDTFTGRGAALLPNTALLEQYVLCKVGFDRAGLTLAEDEGKCVGFVHGGMVPGGEAPVGVTCLIGVRPAFRRRGIGSALLDRSETYLREHGARVLRAGGEGLGNPFYLGLYGGSESAGFLKSDPLAEPFLLHQGYQVTERTLVFQRSLEEPLKLFDPRFPPLRQAYELQMIAPRSLRGAWRERVYGAIDPLEARLVDRHSGNDVARALVWEMEGFTWRWQKPAVGIFDFEVDPELRRKGVGKFFLLSLLRQLQEQFFVIAEIHLPSGNAIGIRFLLNLGFEQVDVGQTYEKKSVVSGP